MELLPSPITTTISLPASTCSSIGSSSLLLHKFSFFPFHHRNNPTPLKCRNHFKIYSNINNNNNNNNNSSTSRDALASEEPKNINVNSKEKLEEIEFVEVFGIGSRRDAVLDFCIASPSLSPSLRFWNILMKDSAEVQLQQRYPVQEVARRNPEAPLSLQSGSKAVILVASAAYSYDHITALDILREEKAGNGLVVGIILKPFSFEGRRRQDEVKDLMSKLHKHATFCIAVDTDALLEKDLVTLDEAFNNSNKAVLMALNAISILTSEKHIKLLNATDSNTIELKVSELRKILETCKEGKIGFGSSSNIKTSILQAVYGCPSLGVGIQDSDSVIVCILASSDVIDCGDMNKIAHTFRLTTGFKGQLILSIIPDPHVGPKLITTTVISLSGQNSSEKSGIFSRLARHFPFVFNIMKKQHQQTLNTLETSCTEIDALNAGDTPNSSFANSIAENIRSYSDIPQTSLVNDSEEISSLRDDGSWSEQSDVKFFEAGSHASTYILNTEGIPAFNRELLTRQNLGPEITEKWVKDGTDDREVTAVHANVSIFRLPVGVKHPEQLNCPASNIKDQPERMDDNKKARSLAKVNMSRNRTAADGLEVVADFYKNASTFEKRMSINTSRRQGVLSIRAASMLEAERHSEKKLSRIVEMKYRGGFYRGQIQGGLPEGKGHLTLADGSIYDGMWRYGKRSGPGTFYYSNGDFFQGSWRDDGMHGKGWLFFNTGDRWFVNFWKGKANGEGRFYSKLGGVFFGHFKDGWRHGDFLHVSVDGTRCHEVWDEGVLVSRTQLDSDASGAGTD